MAKLKLVDSIRNNVLAKMQDILKYLDDIDASKANNLIDWFVEEASIYYKIENKQLFQKYPKDMKRGDIVLVQFGMNVAPELSDDNTGKHFAIIWAQQGLNFIVIPLTKHKQPPENKFAVNVGIIPGIKNGVITYAKLDAMRSVSIRRLFEVSNVPDGKIHLSQELQNEISKVFLEEFVGFEKFSVDKNDLKAYNI